MDVKKDGYRHLIRMVVLVLLYIKIAWLQIWALIIYFPYDINMLWVAEALAVDYLVFFV